MMLRLSRSLLGPIVLCVALGLALVGAHVWLWLIATSTALIATTILVRGRAQSLTLTLASVGTALAVLELVGLAREPSVKIDLQEGLTVPRLVVGWGPRAAGVYAAKEIVDKRLLYDVRYTIDQRRFRKVDAGTQGAATTFLGDSFVFGVGVNDAETLPQLFADREGRRLPVFNLGIGAFSPAQVLATMQSGIVDDLLAKSELLVQFVAPWHAERTSCRKSWTVDAPRYKLADGAVVFAGVCPPPPLEPLKRSAFFRAFIEPRLRLVDHRDVALMVAITRETVRLARDKYHKPMIVYYKREPAFLKRLGWTDEAIMDALRSAGADVLDYSFSEENDPSYCIVGDGHPTGLANELHAKVLARHIADRYPATMAAAALRDDTVSARP